MKTIHFTREAFLAFEEKHGEYSCTLPTGTTFGKRWVRREPYHDPMVMGHHTPCAKRTYVGEYFDCGKKGQIGIRWYRVILRENGALLRGRMATYL